MRKAASVVLIALTLGACTDQDVGTKQTIGAISGAVLGGFLGSQVGKGEGQLWATGIGAVIGGLAGSSIGKSLDEVDKIKANKTNQAALEYTADGQQSTWVNPNSGNSGSTTPVKTYQQDNGQYCREFLQTVTIAGEEQQAYGTACRQPDGSWKIVSN